MDRATLRGIRWIREMDKNVEELLISKSIPRRDWYAFDEDYLIGIATWCTSKGASLRCQQLLRSMERRIKLLEKF